MFAINADITTIPKALNGECSYNSQAAMVNGFFFTNLGITPNNQRSSL
jgi:hypothetical protein